jgi:uncharacterized membrane protein
MTPLIILFASFTAALLINKIGLKSKWTVSFMGRLALAIMLIFTGIAHFFKTELMIAMLPEMIPLKVYVVYLTGALEIAAAIGLLTSGLFRFTSILLIIFFISILPANIVGSIKQVGLGGMENGVQYLYFRIPLQGLFILWAYFFGIHLNKK